MRKVVVLAAALTLVAAGIAFAGDYHYKGTLNCNECHVMHGSQQHGYNPDGTGNYTAIGGAAPYDKLLRNSPNALCLSCHDNQTFAPDVLEANGGTAPTNGRLGGALNMHNTAPYYDGTGHTLGSKATAPGGTWSDATAGLECIDCHMAHGSSSSTTRTTNSYRNLRGPSGAPNLAGISYAVGTNDLTKDVFERSAGGTDHYDLSNVDFNEPSQDSSYYALFCKTCHTNFHGLATDPNMNGTRHPTAGVNISLGQFNNDLYRVKVMSATGDWGTQGVAWATAPATLTPSCFSCHKGHGNKRAFGLIYPDSAGALPITEEGQGSRYRDLCKSCHSQG